MALYLTMYSAMPPLYQTGTESDERNRGGDTAEREIKKTKCPTPHLLQHPATNILDGSDGNDVAKAARTSSLHFLMQFLT
jgi:hypothetical protein